MNEISAATGKLLALSMLQRIDSAALRMLAAHPTFEFASPELLAKNNPTLALALDASGAWSSALILAEQQAEHAALLHTRILSPLDAEYPALLAATKDDPCLLYVRVQLAPSPDKSAAIIGTRRPTRHGKVVAARISRYFVEQGWSVVSGLDPGCGAIAHRAAIDAEGHTMAVLAHGLQSMVPSKHHSLAEDIINSGGALATPYPFGREAASQQFAQRDRIQAGVAQGVVMVQSNLKNSCLRVCSAILDYARWLAVPYPTESDRLVDGAKVSANLWLAEGTATQKLDLLRRHDERILSHLIILHSKEDYAACIRASSPQQLPAAPTQLSMF